MSISYQGRRNIIISGGGEGGVSLLPSPLLPISPSHGFALQNVEYFSLPYQNWKYFLSSYYWPMHAENTVLLFALMQICDTNMFTWKVGFSHFFQYLALRNISDSCQCLRQYKIFYFLMRFSRNFNWCVNVYLCWEVFVVFCYDTRLSWVPCASLEVEWMNGILRDMSCFLRRRFTVQISCIKCL